jgi:hypothetical protein
MSRRIAAALIAVLALSLAACASNDAKRSDVVSAMTDAGLSDEQAECIGDGFDDAFTQDELNEIGGASELDELDDELRAEVDAVLEKCVGGSGDGGETQDGSTTETTGEG